MAEPRTRIEVNRAGRRVPAYPGPPELTSSGVWPASVLLEVHRLPAMATAAAVGIHHGLVINLDHPAEVDCRVGKSERKVLFPKGGMCVGTPGELIPEFRWTKHITTAALHLSLGLMARSGEEKESCRPIRLAAPLAASEPQILGLIQVMRSELQHGAPSGPLYGETLGLCLAIRLRQVYGGQSQTEARRGGLGARRLRRVVEHIHEHCAGPLSLLELARVSGLSAFHFARAFKAELGVSPHQYLQGTRIELAKHLLSSSNLDQEEISRQAGFAHSSHFGHAFRMHTGETPGEFRKQRRAISKICPKPSDPAQ